MKKAKHLFKLVPAVLAVVLMGQGCFIKFSGSGGASDGGVWRTSDKGEHWVQKNAVLSVGGARNMNTVNVTSFSYEAADPLTVYVATDAAGMLFTTDGGESWTQPKDLASARINSIAVRRDNKCVVYAASGGVVVKSSDCTRTWSKIYEETRPNVAVNTVLLDYYNPANVFLATNKGDVIKSTDGGSSWAKTTEKPFNSEIIRMVMDPNDSRVLYIGTKSDGLWKSVDSGANWSDLAKGLEKFDGAKDFYDLIPDRSKRDAFVLVSRYGLIRTENGGTDWKAIKLVTNPGQARIYAAAMNPANGNEMYYSTATVFYKTSDGGNSWTTKRLPTSRIGNAVLVSAKDANVVYLGTLQIKK